MPFLRYCIGQFERHSRQRDTLGHHDGKIDLIRALNADVPRLQGRWRPCCPSSELLSSSQPFAKASDACRFCGKQCKRQIWQKFWLQVREELHDATLECRAQQHPFGRKVWLSAFSKAVEEAALENAVEVAC